MDENSLLEEIVTHGNLLNDEFDIYFLYLGVENPVTGYVYDDLDSIPRNMMQPREALAHLFKAYSHAHKLDCLIDYYRACDFNSYQTELDSWKQLSQKVINCGNHLFDKLLTKHIPE